MLSPAPIHVIGMHPGSLHLPEGTERIAATADVLVGGKRLLAAHALACSPDEPSCPSIQVPISGPLGMVIKKIQLEYAAGRKVVVLADGDPLYFGFAKRLIKEFGADNVQVHPSLTCVQLAAARLNLTWRRMAVVSLHGREDHAPLFAAMMRTDTVAVFTDQKNDPPAIAKALLDKGAADHDMTVLEDLGTPQERIRAMRPEEAWDLELSPLNLVLIQRRYPPEHPPRLDLPDHLFLTEAELITKRPVRAAGLACLGIEPEDTVWDLGSGSGAVAIEAAGLARYGRVVAVERNRRRAAAIRENVRRTGAWLVDVVRGEMPGCLEALPAPDRIFLGGGLGGPSNQGNRLMETACERLRPRGRLVIHCILLDTLHTAKQHIQDLGWHFGMTQIQASTADHLAGDLRFKAENPVFILWAEKPDLR